MVTGEELDLCPVHQAAEIEARRREQEKADAQRVLAREQSIFEELRAPAPEPAPPPRSDLRADVMALIATPAPTGVDGEPVIRIGDDDELQAMLESKLGITNT